MGGKKTNASNMTKEQCAARLEEIGSLSIGAVGDEEALAIIKERKELEALRAELEQAEQRAAEEARLESEAADLRASIEELNRSIAPDKSDEELLALIGRRKELEGKLRAIEAGQPIAASAPAVSEPAASPAPSACLRSTATSFSPRCAPSSRASTAAPPCW